MDNINGAITKIIAAQGAEWGRPPKTADAPLKTLVEFVSADPTGPLSLHQARNGVVGDALANLLVFARRAAFVDREFYVNDAASALRAIARSLWNRRDEDATISPAKMNALPPPALLAALRQNPHAAHYAQIPFEEAAPFLQSVVVDFWLQEQKTTLGSLNVSFDRFFKESELHGSAQVAGLLDELVTKRMASNEYGALWLRSSRIDSEERDYVLRRADGSVTYLAADLAYHKNKHDRGYRRLVDVWNADHAAYVGRTRAGLMALGLAPVVLDVVLCETVRLVKDGTEVKNAGGETIAPLVRELGADAVRFLLLHGRENESLLLDADVARDAARSVFGSISAAWKRAGEVAANAAGAESEAEASEPNPIHTRLADFPYVVQSAAQGLSPFLIAFYTVHLAQEWNAAPKSDAATGRAVKQTLQNALQILRVTPGDGQGV